MDEALLDDFVIYGLTGHALRRVNDVMRRLYGQSRITYDEQRDLADTIRLALDEAVALHGDNR